MEYQVRVLIIAFFCLYVASTCMGGGGSSGHYHYRYSSSNNSNDGNTAAAVIFFVFIFLFFLFIICLGCWWWWCPGDPYPCNDNCYYYTGNYCSQLGHPVVCEVPSCRTVRGPPTRYPPGVTPASLDTTHYTYETDPETGKVREQYRNVSF